jgi:hypothetical protein
MPQRPLPTKHTAANCAHDSITTDCTPKPGQTYLPGRCCSSVTATSCPPDKPYRQESYEVAHPAVQNTPSVCNKTQTDSQPQPSNPVLPATAPPAGTLFAAARKRQAQPQHRITNHDKPLCTYDTAQPHAAGLQAATGLEGAGLGVHLEGPCLGDHQREGGHQGRGAASAGQKQHRQEVM